MTTTAADVPTTRKADPAFLQSRLGSLLAILPLGIWTTAHLWNNLSAFQGQVAWERDVTEYSHPLAFFVSGIVALVPLALHTIWGLARIFTVRPNLVRYGYYANLKYVLQRLSGLGLVGFLGAHLTKAMILPRMKGHAETFEDIAAYMHHHMPTLVVYILGVAGIAYHLANGVQTFCMGWGVVSSRRALKHMEWIVALLFVVLLAMGLASVYALYDAGAALPAPHDARF
jgi:succinate dehydrogenase / fumarate reductase cytochrome b subunit